MIGDNFIFVHIPKTGGNSITEALKFYSVDPIKFIREGNGILLYNGGLEKHASLYEYDDILDTDQYFKFSVIRNPFDRFLSWYYYQVKYFNYEGDQRKFFFDMKDEFLFRPQIDFLKPADDKNNIDFILRYENLESDFDQLCHILGIYAKLKHFNKSDRPEYNMINLEVMELLEEYYIEDFQYYYNEKIIS